MSQFQLTETLNERIFFRQFSEIDERLDPLFYKAVEKIENDIVSKSKYRCESLIKSCSLKRGRFGHRPRNDPDFYGGEYPFIQTGDIVKAAETDGQIGFTQTLNEKGLKTSRMFDPPQLLFTIAANIGDTAILDYSCCFPDSIVSITPKDKDEVSIEFLNYYLRLIKPYVVELAPYSAQRNLNNQQLAQVPIIMPPPDIQAKAVATIKEGYNKKQELENQAAQLLASIDDYILQELGIVLPEKNNSLSNRIFKTQFSELSGKRFDSFHYRLDFAQNSKALSQSTVKVVSFREIILDLKNGIEVREYVAENSNGSKRYLRVSDLGKTELNSNNARYVQLEKIPKRIRLNDQCILLSRSGSLGLANIVTPELYDAVLSSHIFKIQVETGKVDPYYLQEYLRSSIGQSEIFRNNNGGVIPEINQEALRSISIALPTLLEQKRISTHIMGLRELASKKETEAGMILDNAKKEVEQMILK